jgi:hypothetical protein
MDYAVGDGRWTPLHDVPFLHSKLAGSELTAISLPARTHRQLFRSMG